MYGLEEDDKKKPFFEFDLEKDLQDEKKQATTMKQVEKRIREVKDSLRKGVKSEDYEKLGLLLHGYTSLQKVLNRITNQK